MLWIPQSFDDMPHTSETVEVIRGVMYDDMDYDNYVCFLKNCSTFGVYDKGEFCGFFIELFKGDHIEIHCFVYPSKRKVSIKLMHSILESATKRGLYIETTVIDSFSYVARYMKFYGFKEVARKSDYSTINGKSVGLIYLSNKETLYGLI